MTPDNEWSDGLKDETREVVDGLAIVPRDDFVYFKHVRSGFGKIAFADLLSRKLRMVDSDTGQEIVFADSDELIRAGWAID